MKKRQFVYWIYDLLSLLAIQIMMYSLLARSFYISCFWIVIAVTLYILVQKYKQEAIERNRK